jgi:hypothetical protein
MVEKRKLPPRERAESTAKRRLSTPQSQTTSAKRKASTGELPLPSPEPVEESLPTKIQDNKPLPTLPKPQARNLPLREYQSYSER